MPFFQKRVNRKPLTLTTAAYEKTLRACVWVCVCGWLGVCVCGKGIKEVTKIIRLLFLFLTKFPPPPPRLYPHSTRTHTHIHKHTNTHTYTRTHTHTHTHTENNRFPLLLTSETTADSVAIHENL